MMKLSRFALVLSAVLLGSCCTANADQAQQASAETPTKLGDIVKTDSHGTVPTGDYYVTVSAQPDLGARIPDNKCADRSFWSFIRKTIVGARSASAVMTAKITPTGNPGQAITVPVFLTSAAEIDSSGIGSKCQTQFWARPITFTFNSNLNPEFNVDLTLYLNNSTDAAPITNLVKDATSLMTAISAGTGTPAALATTLANPAIQSTAGAIDNQLKNFWTNTNNLQLSLTLNSGANGKAVQDRITFKMPPLVSGAGGPAIADSWDAGGTIYLDYSHEKFKSSGQWIDPDAIMNTVIVPSAVPGTETNLYRLVLNGDAAGGFKLGTLNSANTPEALQDACQNLRLFLASFLIPSDKLAAKFAVLRNSPYDKQTALRANSGCLDPGDDVKLLAMNSAYVFSDHSRSQADDRSAAISSIWRGLYSVLISQNAALIGGAVVPQHANFYVSLGKNTDDYAQGDAGIDKLAKNPVRLSCLQAPSGSDISTIAALAVYKGVTTAALLSFDSNQKLASIILLSPDDAATGLNIALTSWLKKKGDWSDPNTPECLAKS